MLRNREHTGFLMSAPTFFDFSLVADFFGFIADFFLQILAVFLF